MKADKKASKKNDYYSNWIVSKRDKVQYLTCFYFTTLFQSA